MEPHHRPPSQQGTISPLTPRTLGPFRRPSQPGPGLLYALLPWPTFSGPVLPHGHMHGRLAAQSACGGSLLVWLQFEVR